MLVVMQRDASKAAIDAVCEAIKAMGFQPVPMPGEQRTAIGLVGNDRQVDGAHIQAMDGVAQVLYVSKPYKQVSREWKPDDTVVTIAPGVAFGSDKVNSKIHQECSPSSPWQITIVVKESNSQDLGDILKLLGDAALKAGTNLPPVDAKVKGIVIIGGLLSGVVGEILITTTFFSTS